MYSQEEEEEDVFMITLIDRDLGTAQILKT